MSLGEILLAIAAAGGLGIVLLAVFARLNGEDQDADGPDTILIGPAEDPEPLGDQVDVRATLHRYSGD